MLRCFGNKKDDIEKNGFFLRNGAAVLEQIIVSLNGNCNPIRNYSLQELNKATDNFSWSRMIHLSSGYILYKGVHDSREISVKKYTGNAVTSSPFNRLELISNEVAISSRMSEHKNVLKLLGCCLETELPLLVFEFPEKGNLSSFLKRFANGKEEEELPFETKLKISVGLANAAAYLHHGLSNMFIHRDIHIGNVFLDHNYVAKLSEFRLSLPIPEGETHVDAEVCGTTGFIAPEVVLRGRYTEQSDAYNFGILLFELLVGKRYGDLIMSPIWNNDSSCNIWVNEQNLCKSYLEVEILGEENRAQKTECAKLVERCLEQNPDERPSMIQVAQILTSIKGMKC